MTLEEKKAEILTTIPEEKLPQLREWAMICADAALKKVSEVTGIIPIEEERELLVSYYLHEITKEEFLRRMTKIGNNRGWPVKEKEKKD